MSIKELKDFLNSKNLFSKTALFNLELLDRIKIKNTLNIQR